VISERTGGLDAVEPCACTTGNSKLARRRRALHLMRKTGDILEGPMLSSLPRAAFVIRTRRDGVAPSTIGE